MMHVLGSDVMYIQTNIINPGDNLFVVIVYLCDGESCQSKYKP